MRVVASYLALALLGSATPLAAAQFEPPKGCEGVVTVQFKGCLMLNLWQCSGDAKGDQWLGLFTDRGLRRVRKIDREFQWLETFHLGIGLVERMETPVPDAASLSELMETGIDTYDFTISESGRSAGPDLRYQGFDRLTGETTVVDGETLLNTEYGYTSTQPDGTVVESREGRQFVHPEYRLFLFGQSQDADGTDATDSRPMSFAKPGDADFFPALPTVDCGSILS